MKHLSSDPEHRYHNQNVPWQRVINAKGIISPRCASPASRPLFLETNSFRSQPSGAQNQAEALRAEGVTVTENAMGELSVDFKDFGWFPEDLPSIAAEEGS